MSGRLKGANDKWLYLAGELTPQQQLKRKEELEVFSDLGNDRFYAHALGLEDVMKDRRAVGVRVGMATMFYQLGNKLDYLTGISGLSEKILNRYFIPTTGKLLELKELVPAEAQFLFPEVVLEQVDVARTHCPVYILHGRGDQTVKIREAKRTEEQLRKGGVEVKFVGVEKWGHSWGDKIWDKYGGGEGGVMHFFEEVMVKVGGGLRDSQTG